MLTCLLAVQTSVREREGRTDCGPQSAAGQAYPRVVGAALSQLIEAVARDVQATEKVGGKPHSAGRLLVCLCMN